MIANMVQVIVYNAVTRKAQRQFTRFKDKAYCGNFRADNKLLVAGGEDGIVQVQNNTIQYNTIHSIAVHVHSALHHITGCAFNFG